MCVALNESTQDRHWLKTAGEFDWVVLNWDKRIRTRRWEREALIETGIAPYSVPSWGFPVLRKNILYAKTK